MLSGGLVVIIGLQKYFYLLTHKIYSIILCHIVLQRRHKNKSVTGLHSETSSHFCM